VCRTDIHPAVGHGAKKTDSCPSDHGTARGDAIVSVFVLLGRNACRRIDDHAITPAKIEAKKSEWKGCHEETQQAEEAGPAN
jgi:hypothetical protein